MVMVLLIFIQDVIIYLIHQYLLNLLEIEDLVVLLLYNGLHQQVLNGKMIQMHFYFLLINKKFILIKKMEKLFAAIKIMDLLLDVGILYIQDNMVSKRSIYIHMNQIQILVIISMGIIMLYLKMVRLVGFMQLNMKYFRLYFLNYLKLFYLIKLLYNLY